MTLQGSYLRFGACYEDKITTIRFSETKSLLLISNDSFSQT